MFSTQNCTGGTALTQNINLKVTLSTVNEFTKQLQ